MKKYPVKSGQQALRKREKDGVEVIGPAPSFFSFHYSFTEISAQGGKARVRSRRARLENGKLTTESLEGELDRTAYDRMVAEAQNYFLTQTALVMKSLSLLLPFFGNGRSDRD
jgi:hypothetical protein